jgi:hypothetical protein
LYDQQILLFVLCNAAEINRSEIPDRRVDPRFGEFFCLLETFFSLMMPPESSIIALGRAHPLIANAIKQLENFANAADERTIPETDLAVMGEIIHISRSAARYIHRYTLDSTHILFQLAYLLTPTGHLTARLQLRDSQTFAEETKIRESIELENCVSQLADHSDGETDEASGDEDDVEVPVEEDEAREAGDHELPAAADEVTTLGIFEIHDSTNLVGRGREGLERIIAQFQLGPADTESVLQVFVAFIADKDRNLALSRSMDGERFSWQATLATHPSTTLFA